VTDKPIDLDLHRGMASQQATDLRRTSADVEANDDGLRQRREELERNFVTLPAETWEEAAARARYLLGLLDGISGDARVKTMILAVLADFDRLARRER
jgi:hypothetical protein